MTDPKSKTTTRMWLFAYNHQHIPFIYEFKPLQIVPGVAGFHAKQRNPLGRTQLAIARMYGDYRFLTQIQLLTIDSAPYLLRAKMLNPLKHDLDHDMSEKQKNKFADYAAFMMGEFHHRSPDEEDERLASLIEEYPDEFAEVVERTTQQINDVMEIGFKKTKTSKSNSRGE